VTAVQIEGLRCRVGGRVVLDVPRLQIQSGERVVLIGPNGAGKSTLLRCLGCFMPAGSTEGRVQVLGRTLPLGRAALRALRSEVGQVLQGVHLVQRLSVLDNTLIGALGRLHGLAAWHSWARRYPPMEIEAALQALRSVGLAGREAERADRLSGGERQKVAMARMLLQRPRLVLADEPTASLDPAAAHEACALLSQASQGATLISIVHDPALVPLLGHRVLGLREGRIAFDRPAADLDVALCHALYGRDVGMAPHFSGTMTAA
jgi:phosphonate transport system ATP-binding protein